MELEHPQPTALVRRAAVALEPVMDVPTALDRMAKLQEFCAHYLSESKDGGNDGGDFGIIPGAGKKKVLLKSGADKLCDVYGLADTYRVLSSAEDWNRGLFEYTLECRLQSKVDDSLVGSGLGSCSSFESKYRWRDQQRTCPTCGKAAIIKGKEDYGGGWLCWKKKEGCGAKFRDGDKAIEDQPSGRVENPDIADTRNTVLKMAKKRAKIDAVIGVTRSSGIFTQDLEDVELTPRAVVTEHVNTTTGEITETPAPRPVAQAEFPEQNAQGPCGPTRSEVVKGRTVYTTLVDAIAYQTLDMDLADVANTFEGHVVDVRYRTTAKGGRHLLSIIKLSDTAERDVRRGHSGELTRDPEPLFDVPFEDSPTVGKGAKPVSKKVTAAAEAAFAKE